MKVIDVFLAIPSMDTFSSGVQAVLSVVVDYQPFCLVERHSIGSGTFKLSVIAARILLHLFI